MCQEGSAVHMAAFLHGCWRVSTPAGQQDCTPRLTDSATYRQSSAIMRRVEEAAVFVLLVTEFASCKTFSRSVSSHFLGRNYAFVIKLLNLVSK